MKELDYEDWQKNPTPRMMWVWDNCEKVDELKKENAKLKTRWECRNKYVCSDNGRGVPCYIYHGCLNCYCKSE